MPDFQQNHFELFGLPQRFAVDLARLDRSYRALQSRVHPDRFAAASPAERLHSMQIATRVNEAYQTLKSPRDRARYLLSLHGVDTGEDTNTAMPAAFLMRQMEWREAVEETLQARDAPALEQLLRELQLESSTLEHALGMMLDEQQNFVRAAETVCKLRFLDKVRVEIEQAIESLEQ